MDEPTEGIQPNIVAEIEDVIRSLKDQGDLSVLLVEQSLDFALNASDYFYVLEKGSVAVRGNSEQAEEERIRKHLVV